MQMPPLSQPIMHTLSYHYRTGGHAVTAFDWQQFLSFADMHLRARCSMGRYNVSGGRDHFERFAM